MALQDKCLALLRETINELRDCLTEMKCEISRLGPSIHPANRHSPLGCAVSLHTTKEAAPWPAGLFLR